MTDTKPILIIGAGVSGLALAQGLRNAGLPFKIFESDSSTGFRAQGYRIRINKAGGAALQACLTPELWQKFQDSCGQPPRDNARLDAITGEPHPMGFGPPKGPGGIPTGAQGMWESFTADRNVLRELLLEGLDDHVYFGHKLNSFDVSDTAVTAHFEGGVSVEGCLLIAADGAGSKVRRQYLPDHKILDTGVRCIYGKTTINSELVQSWSVAAKHGAFLIRDESGEDGSKFVIFGETIRFQDNHLRSQLPDDYVYWVLTGDQKFFLKADSELLHLTASEAVQHSRDLTRHWHEPFQALLKMQDSTKTAALRVSVASPDLEAWEPSSRITLIGDAIHLMPPTGGIGANTALQDSAALAAILKQDGVTLDAIKRYEVDMRARAIEAITQSLQGGKHMLGMKDWTEFKQVDA